MTEFKAAIFDLDGVIADTARSHYQAWKKLADSLDIGFDEQVNERLKGVPRLASLDIVLERSARSFTSAEKEALAASKNEHYLDLITEMTSDDLLPGARHAVEEMRRTGLKTALASASKNAVALVSYLQIGDVLDYIADANFIKNHKPHPEIFLNAAQGLGVDPKHCIAFEDAVAGIEAIRAAGMFAVGIGDPKILSSADIVFSSLGDVPPYLYLG